MTLCKTQQSRGGAWPGEWVEPRPGRSGRILLVHGLRACVPKSWRSGLQPAHAGQVRRRLVSPPHSIQPQDDRGTVRTRWNVGHVCKRHRPERNWKGAWGRLCRTALAPRGLWAWLRAPLVGGAQSCDVGRWTGTAPGAGLAPSCCRAPFHLHPDKPRPASWVIRGKAGASLTSGLCRTRQWGL